MKKLNVEQMVKIEGGSCEGAGAAGAVGMAAGFIVGGPFGLCAASIACAIAMLDC